jgi:AcrR family transcriptional regulator
MKDRACKNVTEVRVVEAAVQLFSQQGYKGTSTKDISRLADVNEATLFRYFPRKIDVFWAAAESRLDRVRISRELQSRLAGGEELQVTIPLLLRFLVAGIFEQPELVRLMFVAGFEVPGGEDLLREHLGPIFDLVYGFFQRCSSKGLIGDVEPSIAALGIAGIVGAHQNLYPLLTGKELGWESEAATLGYANFVLRSLGIPNSGSSSTAEF